jgi:outer membrane protein assembly factor BamA
MLTRKPTNALALLLLTASLPATGFPSVNEADSADSREQPIIEPFPILSYDTDAGFGYGVKVVFRNQLGFRESFDLTLFNSTKGERWYRLVASLPDAEMRQGTSYPIALDLTVDYDKWINNSFFGVGSDAPFDQREFYTKEPLDLSLTVSRGFSPALIAGAGVRFRAVRNFGFSDTSRLATLPPELNAGRVSYTSLFVSARYDTRNSTIGPTKGLVLQGDMEVAPGFLPGNISFARYGLTVQHYRPVIWTSTTFALRGMLQCLSGDDLPVQVLLPIGGNATLRGFTQDRYLDCVSAVLNAELRFPVYRRLGGLLGVDAGKVWHTLGALDLTNWAVNPTIGLRFTMETFVVRVDVGLGREITGFYFNFGQLF